MLHPTIVIAYGDYGLRCLTAVLAGASARGVLQWEERQQVGSLPERHLKGLGLVWVPDPPRNSLETNAEERPQVDAFEMMQDLYGQIETIEAPTAADLPAVLSGKVETMKQRIFNEYFLAVEDQQIQVGLDVIVLAQPREASSIGKLRETTEPMMKRIAQDPGLRSVSGQERLNFIMLLDFEDFWEPSGRQEGLREATFQMVEAGQHAAVAGLPSVGRLYLMDGRTERGNHNESIRMQEVVLFLDFLLFEDHRADVSLRVFYQREMPSVSPLSVIGVRAVQYSPDRLRRLAAADFARNWLEYLAASADEDAATDPIKDVVGALAPGKLEITLPRTELTGQLEAAERSIEAELAKVPASHPDWPAEVLRIAEEQAGRWQERLDQVAGECVRQGLEARFSDLHANLVRAVSLCLANEAHLRCPGAVLSQIDHWRNVFAGGPKPAVEPRHEPSIEAGQLRRVHDEYLAFVANQLKPERLREFFWPLFSVVLGVLYQPLLRDAIAVIAGEDWAPPPVQMAVTALVLFLLFLAVGLRVFHPLVEASVLRAREFYLHRERGRLTSHLRAVAGSEAVRGQLQRTADRVWMANVARIHAEVDGELERLRNSLAERIREARWLAGQLKEYLNLHGVVTTPAGPEFLNGNRDNLVSYSLETGADLQAIAQRRPARRPEFRDAQLQLRPLTNWDSRFSDTFLDPHRFLDKLADWFPPSSATNEPQSAGERASALVDALADYDRLPTSFYWQNSASLPEAVRFCSVPQSWLLLEGVASRLRLSNFASRICTRPGGDRVYLVKARLGIPTHLLRSTTEVVHL